MKPTAADKKERENVAGLCIQPLAECSDVPADNRAVMHFGVHDYDHRTEGQLRLMNRVCWYDSLAPASVAGVAPALLPGAVVDAGADARGLPLMQAASRL